MKNKKRLFEKEKTYYSNQKKLKRFSKPWKPLSERAPATPKTQPLDPLLGQLLQVKGKISKEAQETVGTINIEEKYDLRQRCGNIIEGKLKKY